MEQTNGAHVAVYGELTDADVETLASLPGRGRRRGARRARTCTAPLAGAAVDVGLEALPADASTARTSPRAASRQPRPRCSSSAASPARTGLRVGDTLTLGDSRATRSPAWP